MKKYTIFDFWPFPENLPNNNQIKALMWLEDNYDQYDHFILDLPVGGGKSWIAMTFARFLTSKRGYGSESKAMFLTPQKILQRQYLRDFESFDMVELKGKQNYRCTERPSLNCKISEKLNPQCSSCVYQAQKHKATQANFTILNYSIALSLLKHSGTFKQTRKLCVCDEGHNLDKILTDFDAILIDEELCKELRIEFIQDTDTDNIIQWIGNILIPRINDHVELLAIQTDGLRNVTNLTKHEMQLMDQLDSMVTILNNMDAFVQQPLEYIKKEYVIDFNKYDNIINVKRVTGSHSFHSLLAKQFDKFLYMSATFLSKQQFCKDLDLDPNNVAFLSCDSLFPVENRPIYYWPTFHMNKNWKSNNERNKLIDKIVWLLNEHKDQSGIIHTSNSEISNWIASEIQDRVDHKVFVTSKNTNKLQASRDAVINRFLKHSTPAVLISPSITEGLDLKDDLGRFAIFAKIPYPNLGDKWIRTRMDMSNEWYIRQTWIGLIQGSGRIVRNATDKGAVYILDSSFKQFYNRNNYMAPKWWKDSLIFV